MKSRPQSSNHIGYRKKPTTSKQSRDIDSMNKIWKYDQNGVNDIRKSGLSANKTSYGGFKISDNNF